MHHLLKKLALSQSVAAVNISKMEQLKVYGINITALVSTSMSLNQTLQTVVLILTIIYTGINILKQLKNGKD
jgi:hypothetical protein